MIANPVVEKTLEETKRVVRSKLGLAADADVKLEQLREGKAVDLEDGEFSRRIIHRKMPHRMSIRR